MTEPKYNPNTPINQLPNNIRKIVANPCQASPMIYIETAIGAIGTMAWFAVEIDPNSIARGALLPKSRRGWNRYNRGEELAKAEGADGELRTMRGLEMPDIGMEIGRALPGAEEAKAVISYAGKHFFLPAIKDIDKALFYWFLADMAGEGAAYWQSALHEIGCSKPLPVAHGVAGAHCTMQGTMDLDGGIIFGSVPSSFAWGECTNMRNGWGTTWAYLGDGYGTITAGYQVQGLFGDPGGEARPVPLHVVAYGKYGKYELYIDAFGVPATPGFARVPWTVSYAITIPMVRDITMTVDPVAGTGDFLQATGAAVAFITDISDD